MTEHEHPAGSEPATVEPAGAQRPGVVIAGRYKLLEQIGEGGMGTVWVAEQAAPVKRRVALKLIKPGMDSRQVISRFEAERQALALMDHPHIAKVYDGGMTEEGRPFFVMEYVKGVPITEYCDSARLKIDQRLKLFVSVCQAVQHAHQKGVIHRDLKPSNILVCLYDGQPVPKVIDFGLAKAISQPLTEHTLYTAHGLMVGTPAYMSPEQAELNNFDIDTRTDVYSLGVILYELLTGTTPLEKQQLKNAAFQEILRLIKEVEPQRPSLKISSSISLPSIAAQRSLEPAQLRRAVRGDLDWIVMKALEKERNRRYETASGLARDIDRYLHDEPVEASPPSASYRLRKFSRKHRALLSTAATIVALLIVGITVSTWQAIRATRAEAAAKSSEQKARLAGEAERTAKNKALVAATAAQQARQAALEREAETKAVLDFVENKIFAAARPEGQVGGLGRDITLREALEKSLAFVEESFRDRPLIEARLRSTLGTSFYYLGEAQIAAGQQEAAWHIYSTHRGPDHPATLGSMNYLASSYSALGRHPEALKLYEETLALRKAKFGPNHPDTLTSMNNLANSYFAIGRHAEALKLYEETLALRKVKLGPDQPATISIMNDLANSYSKIGRQPEALKLREETLALRKAKLGPDHPDTLANMHNLTGSYFSLGLHAEALKLNEETLALRKAKLGPDHPATLQSMYFLAGIYFALGRHSEALKLHEETFALRKARLGPDHPDTLKSVHGLAVSYSALGRHSEALKLDEETLALRKAKLGENHPNTLDSIKSVAIGYSLVNRHGDALELCRAAAQLWEKLSRTDATSLYRMACLRAVTSSVIRAANSSEAATKEATAEADRAMEWLQKAVAAGYKNAFQVAQNRDLDALRGREDFQKLLAELEAGQKKPQ